MNRLVVLGATAWALSIAFFIIQVLAQAASNVGPVGITERIADYPALAMIVVVGAYLLVASARSRRLPIGHA